MEEGISKLHGRFSLDESRFHGRKGAMLSGMKVAFMEEGISNITWMLWFRMSHTQVNISRRNNTCDSYDE